MTQSDQLLHAYKTLPVTRLCGEFAKYDKNGNMLYDTNAWLLHCIGVPDEVLISLTGNIGDDPEHFSQQHLVKMLEIHYGLTKEQLAKIERLNDESTPDAVDSYIYMIYRLMDRKGA